jgi:CAP12/Pycsar effector protein, TIR domain
MGATYDPAERTKPCVFVGSSSECAKYGVAMKKILEEEGTLSVTYGKDLFGSAGAGTAIEIISKAAEEKFNFAVFILSPDDVRTLRGESSKVPRDNVIFEMGLFIGSLGRDCVFLITSDKRDAKLPGDMGGVNVETWIDDEENPDSAVRSSANTFRQLMEKRWRERSVIHSSPSGRFADSRATDSDDSEVWLLAYEAGALEDLEPGRVRIGIRIVHPIWGAGQVTELGPWQGGARYLTVVFPRGSATILSENIARQKFVNRD